MAERDEIEVVVKRFNEAWNNHDLEGALSVTTTDCVFESTGPPPDGRRFEGRAELRKAWEPIFKDENSHFDWEDIVVGQDHVAQRWRYRWSDGHVRGVDVIRVRGGKISEKLSYVKG
jgi:uncharacterized protein (TIGR02246 family)